MKKILLFAAVSVALSASAEVLTPAQALERVRQVTELTDNGAVRRMTARNAAVAIPVRTVSSAAGLPQLYLFADGENGLMIVSAESESEALMGYTDSYSPDQQVPPALEYMISCYAAEIEAVRAGVVTYAAESVFDLNSPAISPICTTRWDQGAPYNAMCPMLNGQRSVTGCVATAMAQVLKTYEYPEKCSGGTFSYFWEENNTTLSMNFNEVTLDWADMGDRYTAEESAPAVAELMKAVAYSAQMGFSPYASGAHGIDMAVGLIRNFDYDCTLTYERREWYSLGEWHQKVYDVLASGHALYYDGVNPGYTSAHAFVVDGYQGDGLFHLNWGWGGMSDGYFRLTALDPAAQGIGGSTAGYDREQGAIFNMIPGGTTNVSDAPYVFFMTTGFRSARTTSKLNANTSFLASSGGGIYNCGPNTVEKFKLAVKFVKSTGEIFWFSSESLYGKCAPYSGVTGTFSCYLTDELTEGSYMVSPAVYNPTTGKYYDVKYPVGAGGTFGAEISGNTITFSTAQKSSLSAVEVTIPEVIYQNTPFEIKATLLNPGPEEYYGPVTVKLFKKGTSTEVAILGNVVVSAVPGEPVDAAAYFKLEGTSVAVGEYDLGMIDQYSNEVTERVAVTLEEEMPQGTPTCKSMRATNKAQDQLTFRMNLSCTGGMYINPVYVVLTEYGGSNVLTYFASPTVTLDPNGGIVSVYASCDFHQGTPGARYTAYPYYVYNGNIVQMGGSKISFYLEEPTSGIDNIEGGESAPVEYYDLGGRRVVEPKNGIYIRKQGSEVTKVVL
ncbi:MAG: hypothetical protein E7082_04585 [Bacteroidales bacterium]|nr:hypothetical protein [Bacteroidales bacterium]